MFAFTNTNVRGIQVDMTMQKTRSVFVLFVGVLALCGGVTVGQTVRSDSKTAVSQAQREFDPDAGSEAPFDAGQYDGEVAVAADGCESNGAFTATFTATTRYRGNLYRVTHSGVFLREIKMQLAFAGTADLFVSVHKKDLDGTYSQIDINSSNASLKHIVIPGAEGSGETIPEFYGTGGLGGVEGVPLPPGDYAIAFSWGPFSIKYGRDSGVTYPRSFAVGSIRGSVATDLLQNEPPMRDILPAMSVFTGGVYSMQICLVPAAGACCQSTTQSCVEVFEEECLGAGSFFHGQRTLCAETPCNFGACCFECAQQVGFPVRCEDGYAPERCSLDGGAAHWPGVSCPPGDAALCPKVTGACCNGVDCTLQCEAECLTNQGTYRGDGTDCEPDFCQGACCSSSGCFNTTQTNCTTFAGPLAFRGRGHALRNAPAESGMRWRLLFRERDVIFLWQRRPKRLVQT